VIKERKMGRNKNKQMASQSQVSTATQMLHTKLSLKKYLMCFFYTPPAVFFYHFYAVFGLVLDMSQNEAGVNCAATVPVDVGPHVLSFSVHGNVGNDAESLGPSNVGPEKYTVPGNS
jgi:hypothetical protein